MYPIYNKKEARCWYGFLRLMKSYGHEYGVVSDSGNICDIKRALREYSHIPPFTYKIDGHEVYARCVKSYDIDGYVELIKFPDSVKDRESAEEFFDAYLYRECRPSMYDCTGDSFTNWRKIFVRRGEYWCYHSVSFDL